MITSNLKVNGQELSKFLDISPQAISGLKKNGIIETEGTGKYSLLKSVVRYIQYLRKNDCKKKYDIDQSNAELVYWKKENEKSKSKDWRLDYGRTVAIEILHRLELVSARLKGRAKDDAELQQLFESLLSDIKTIDPNAVALSVEGGMEEAADED